MEATLSVPQHSSVYQIVTDQIIKQLQSGVAPWHKPWSTSAPRNLVTQKDYRGLNVFLLASQGYASPYWLTFNQCQRLGGRIRQGEHSTLVTFWKFGEHITEHPETGEDEKHTSVLLRYYRVFNIEQTEGIADKLNLASRPRVPSIGDCERVIAEMPNQPKHEQSDRAWYRPSCDTVGMPARDSFHSAEEYYSTLFHELTHSTGHATRVGREGIEKLNTFGSESYSKEELIAELGAAMLCGICGISPATIENSASYLQSWINVLKSDSRMIVSAASHAQKAADYILGKTQSERGAQ